MGLILDASIVIAAERRGHTVRQILEKIQAKHGEIDIALSVVTIAELMHGAYRAKADGLLPGLGNGVEHGFEQADEGRDLSVGKAVDEF